MAKDAKPATDSGDAAPAKSSKKLLIIILLVVLVVGLGGLSAFLLLRSNAAHDEDGDEAVVEKAKPAKK
ncbi:MAG TPA: flagellar basal body protein FliL, partial [Candidatus Accumulibacter sp.]|nr:flagellar basal body protein FliL [Accumulibacter sp.]HCV12297.1 flagellar basal body protein FliL [Accumulibacter sp.]